MIIDMNESMVIPETPTKKRSKKEKKEQKSKRPRVEETSVENNLT